MRILVVLMVACGGSVSPPRASPPPPPAPTAYAGRVGIAGQSWTDVVIVGTGAAAHELCDVVVASEQRGLSRLPVTGVYTRPCALDALAAPPTKEPYLLVDSRLVDQDSVVMELMLAGRSEQLQPAHGTRTTRVPMDDRATCEAMKAHLDADDAAAHQASITAIAELLAQELELTKQREQAACAADAAGAPCRDARLQREVLDEKQHAPPPAAPTAMRSCEQASGRRQ